MSLQLEPPRHFIAHNLFVSEMYETVVDVNVEGDAVLPVFDFTGWHSHLLHDHPIDERHKLAFKIYKRSRNPVS